MPKVDIEALLDPKYRVGELTLLIDGDIYAHQAASITDGRMYSVGPSLFKYKKDADNYCSAKGIDPKEITVRYDPEPFRHASGSLKAIINNIQLSMQHKSNNLAMRYYLTPKNIFRSEILPHYKWNRLGVDEVIRRCGGDEEMARDILRMKPETFEKNKGIPPHVPEHLNKLKEFLLKRYDAVRKELYEADDLIGIAAHELELLGKPYAIVSIDKDFDCIPGVHYNTNKDEVYNVTEDEARHNFYYQCLLGDSTDNIPGIPGVGKGKAAKILDGMLGSSDRAYYEKVLEAWTDALGDEGVDGLHASAKCLWILKDSISPTLEDKIWKPPIEK